MNENQKKWLLDLQDKGVRIDLINLDGTVVERNIDQSSGRKNNLIFAASAENYRLPAQSIPDIPDWRELCGEMQSKGIYFYHQDVLDKHCVFGDFRENYSIKRQPIPEWREEMTEETKPDPRGEIPHREQQIQWYEDWLHHLRTGEPMREYEFRPVNEDGDAASEWKLLSNRHPLWAKTHEYRRKPRTVTYWHCVVIDNTGVPHVKGKAESRDALERVLKIYDQKKVSPITETTVELED